MKRFSSITTLMLATLLSFSQMALPQYLSSEKQELKARKADQSQGIIPSSPAMVAPFWSNDFSNPSDWVLDNGGQTSPYGWTIDAVNDSWYFNSPISSTSGGNFAELYNGDPTSGSGTQVSNVTYTMTIANAIDVLQLAGTDNVTLTFEEYGARFNDLQEVQVSTDGITFTTVADNLNYSVLSQAGGSAYSNPSLRSINLYPYIAGNASTVWIRYSWTTNFPAQSSNPGVWITYGWMIDDINLISTSNYVMQAIEANHGGWYTTPVSQGFSMQYMFKPLIQSAANPYKFELVAANQGAQTLNGARLNVEVFNDIGVLIHSDVSDTINMAPFDTVVFSSLQTFDPAALGVYNINIWGSADSFPTTPITALTSIITDTIYGRDEDVAGGGWRVGRMCGGLQLGNIFDVYAADDLTSVSAHVADYSVAGAKMFGVLYEVDTTSSPISFILLEQTDDYTIQASDLDNWVSIPFNSAISIDPQFGQQYMITIGGYAHPIDTFGISVSGDAEPTMSRIQDNGCNLGTQGFGYWYWINNTPMIRMNFGTLWTPSSINETTFNGNLSIYPNPTNGIFTIEMNDVEKDVYTIKITNVLGQKIFRISQSVNGIYKENIDLATFQKGVYLIQIKNSTTTITERIIVE